MATKKPAISVRLDDEAKRRVELAARLVRQSAGAFLEKAGEVRARQVLLEWAVTRHRQGDASFSELAQETGLAVEEIMMAMGSADNEDNLAMFLSSCRTLAEEHDNPDFFRTAEEAVKTVRRQRSAAA